MSGKNIENVLNNENICDGFMEMALGKESTLIGKIEFIEPIEDHYRNKFLTSPSPTDYKSVIKRLRSLNTFYYLRVMRKLQKEGDKPYRTGFFPTEIIEVAIPRPSIVNLLCSIIEKHIQLKMKYGFNHFKLFQHIKEVYNVFNVEKIDNMIEKVQKRIEYEIRIMENLEGLEFVINVHNVHILQQEEFIMNEKNIKKFLNNDKIRNGFMEMAIGKESTLMGEIDSLKLIKEHYDKTFLTLPTLNDYENIMERLQSLNTYYSRVIETLQKDGDMPYLTGFFPSEVIEIAIAQPSIINLLCSIIEKHIQLETKYGFYSFKLFQHIKEVYEVFNVGKIDKMIEKIKKRIEVEICIIEKIEGMEFEICINNAFLSQLN